MARLWGMSPPTRRASVGRPGALDSLARFRPIWDAKALVAAPPTILRTTPVPVGDAAKGVL